MSHISYTIFIICLCSDVPPCQNIANEFQVVFGMLQNDNFVRHVAVSGHRVPSVVLYTDRQIHELKAFCFGSLNGSLLSFDKTFNLGSIYVTVSMYKNMALNRSRTDDNKIFIGLIFLHGHSDFETYTQFFGHISAKLVDSDAHKLTLGSDEELAMRKNMSHFFPNACLVACVCATCMTTLCVR